MPRVSFKTKDGKRVTFRAGGGKKKKASKGKARGRFIVYTVHDGGERYVRRWSGSSEKIGLMKMREWASRSGRADLVKVDGDREIFINEAY